MRAIASVTVLAVLSLVACSGSNEGPRGGAGVGGASGAPAVGGASVGGTSPIVGGSVASGGTLAWGGSGNASGAAGSGTAGTSSVAPTAHVTTWVPWYRIEESKQALSTSFEGTSMADGLSFLALQFWLVDGPSTRLDKVTDADVQWFRDWSRQHGVKILLCVHNNTGDWNWPEAVRSFRDNRDAFAAHLVTEMTARGLDGIDLDLEGIVDPTADDAQSYLAFVQTLSSALRPMGKILTVDSFHGQWNAPNWSWWPDLLPLVDGITSMGYEQSGMGVDYQELVDHAAVAPQKLMIGVPSYHGTWLGHGVGEQLGWIVQQGQVGTAIWDASLGAPEWRQRSVWEQLETIKSR